MKNGARPRGTSTSSYQNDSFLITVPDDKTQNDLFRLGFNNLLVSARLNAGDREGAACNFGLSHCHELRGVAATKDFRLCVGSITHRRCTGRSLKPSLIQVAARVAKSIEADIG